MVDQGTVHFNSLIGLTLPKRRIKIIEISEYVCKKDFGEIREGESIWAGEHPDKSAMFISENKFGESIPIG